MWECGYSSISNNFDEIESLRSSEQQLVDRGPQEGCWSGNYGWWWNWGRSEEIIKIQSSEEHFMERVTMFGNVSQINFIIGYDETDLGLVTVCLAGNHILSFLNVSFYYI